MQFHFVQELEEFGEINELTSQVAHGILERLVLHCGHEAASADVGRIKKNANNKNIILIAESGIPAQDTTLHNKNKIVDKTLKYLTNFFADDINHKVIRLNLLKTDLRLKSIATRDVLKMFSDGDALFYCEII